jgi:hypothetical protein
LCFSTTPSRSRWTGRYIYSVLGQDGSIESKIVLKRCSRAEMGPTMRSTCGTAWSPLFWSLWHPPLTSCSHGPYFLKKWQVKIFGSIWRPEGP